MPRHCERNNGSNEATANRILIDTSVSMIRKAFTAVPLLLIAACNPYVGIAIWTRALNWTRGWYRA